MPIFVQTTGTGRDPLLICCHCTWEAEQKEAQTEGVALFTQQPRRNGKKEENNKEMLPYFNKPQRIN
jgi:hypothetical protein